MKEEEFGPIEQEITKEETPVKTKETSKSSPKIEMAKLLQVLTSLALHLKRPKIITLAILIGVGFLAWLALNLQSLKQQETAVEPSLTANQASPIPSTDPNLANIAQRVETYGKKIDTLDNFKKKLTKPIVDLEIDFGEE